jgi:SAM-dependent methyltransferase
MRRFFRSLLWRLIRRDFIALKPDWQVITRGRDFGLVGDGAFVARRYLPVAYPYHIDADWRIEYRIRGAGTGCFVYSLGLPNEEAFCTTRLQVNLPFTWLVQRRDRELIANGTPRATKPFPKDAAWLYGVLEFVAESGELFTRNTTHRVRCNAGREAGYFHGGAYRDYEDEPGISPDGILDDIARHCPLFGRFLDVGCATGLLVEAAQKRGLEAEGVDFSSWAVEKANIRTGGSCVVMDMDSAEPSQFRAPYDIIVMHSVIEHLAEPERALRLLFNLLKPGGAVYIQTLNADSLMHRLLQLDWSGYSDYTHRSPWITAAWLEETVGRIGYKVLSLRRYGVWNDNMHDEVWRAFAELIQIRPASTLLEQEFGDVVEIILRRPE